MNSTTDPPGEAALPVPGWRKSTFSEAGNCAEVSENWRKSSRSVAAGNCVEAGSAGSGVLVRDTADRSGPVIAFTAEAWARFTSEAGL